jgi:hypothetical protein
MLQILSPVRGRSSYTLWCTAPCSHFLSQFWDVHHLGAGRNLDVGCSVATPLRKISTRHKTTRTYHLDLLRPGPSILTMATTELPKLDQATHKDSDGDDETPATDSPEIAQHIQTMDRLSRAIDKALEHHSAGDSHADSRRAIYLMINFGPSYMVPWKACSSWKVWNCLSRDYIQLLMILANGNLP